MLTKRQKLIASATEPSVSNFLEDGIKTSILEIKNISAKTRGKYFDLYNIIGCTEFFSCSPNGKKVYFEYEFCHPCDEKTFKIWKATARKAARLHAKGEIHLAQDIDKDNWNHYRTFRHK